MTNKVNLGILLLSTLVVIVQRTTVISGQQEEKFFYHPDFTGGSDHQVAESKPDPIPVFPDGPLHVSLGLRALSGDNRPGYSESIANSQAQVVHFLNAPN